MVCTDCGGQLEILDEATNWKICMECGYEEQLGIIVSDIDKLAEIVGELVSFNKEREMRFA